MRFSVHKIVCSASCQAPSHAALEKKVRVIELENTAAPGAMFACICTEPQLKCQSENLVVDLWILCLGFSSFQTIG